MSRTFAITFLILVAVIGSGYGGYLLANKAQGRVLLPAHAFRDAGDSIVAIGTWLTADDQTDTDAHTTEVRCTHADMMCVESAAGFIAADGRRVLTLDQNRYQIASWTDDEVVTKTLDRSCEGAVVTLGRRDRTARLTRRSTDVTSKRCKSAPTVDLELHLGDRR